MYDAHFKAGMKLALGALLMGAAGAAAGGPIYNAAAASQFSASADETVDRMFRAHANAMAGVAGQQSAMTVDVQGQTRTIQASSLVELRNAFKRIYAERFPG